MKQLTKGFFLIDQTVMILLRAMYTSSVCIKCILGLIIPLTRVYL